MCTLIALHRLRADRPLVVAANRDEFLTRRADPPAWLAPGCVGGRDARGGTWLGVNHVGLFVGLTNQRTGLRPEPARPSRGGLVLRALQAGSVGAIEALLAALQGDYPPFNLLFGDGERLVVAYGRPGLPAEVHDLPPGLHVLCNDRLGSPHFPKAARAAACARPLVDLPWEDCAAGLHRVLADHTQPEAVPPSDLPLSPAVLRGLQALCVHLPGYGTRSAALVALRPGAVLDHRHADGPPCEVGWAEVGRGALPSSLDGR
ncbi:MAG: NRDE family protein [Pseudomonadota bacterium]